LIEDYIRELMQGSAGKKTLAELSSHRKGVIRRLANEGSRVALEAVGIIDAASEGGAAPPAAHASAAQEVASVSLLADTPSGGDSTGGVVWGVPDTAAEAADLFSAYQEKVLKEGAPTGSMVLDLALGQLQSKEERREMLREYLLEKICTNDACPNEAGKVKTFRCGGCHIHRYCSVECQTKDRHDHAERCERIKRRITKARAAADEEFEDVLLDTWDDGADADMKPLLAKLTKKTVNYRTKKDSSTPCMILAAIGVASTKECLAKCKSLGGNPAAVDKEGWNALHWAAYHGSAVGATFLLSDAGHGGIKLGLANAKDKEGMTPLDHAKAEGNTEVVTIIENAMASGEVAASDDGLRKRK
jgi:hypothetical protein